MSDRLPAAPAPTRVIERVTRLGLVIAAGVIGTQGMRYLIDPASVVDGTTVSTATIDERHVLRGGYGGVLVAVAALAAAGSVRGSLRHPALVTVAVTMGGLAVGRTVSLVVDGKPSASLMSLLVIEVALAVAATVLIAWAQPRRREAGR
jgi:hypothetical protein